MILADTGHELSRGQARDWRTDGHTHRQTDAGNDNTRRPILASGKKHIIKPKYEKALQHSYVILVLFHYKTFRYSLKIVFIMEKTHCNGATLYSIRRKHGRCNWMTSNETNHPSRAFETLRDLTIRRLMSHWTPPSQCECGPFWSNVVQIPKRYELFNTRSRSSKT